MTKYKRQPTEAQKRAWSQRKYGNWIQKLAEYQGGRPHFADQQPESLYLLEKLVEMTQPKRIVELGTAHGLSTRLWIDETGDDVEIICIDAGFTPLKGSNGVLPVDFSRLTLVEKWVHDVDLPALWADGKKTILYVDIHSDHQHVFNAIPTLPVGSVVIFDDLWYSEEELDTEEKREKFREEVVKPQVDFTAPLAIWPLAWDTYWRGGSFWGFPEVHYICAWTKENRVKLHWEEEAKVVWFLWPQDKEE